MERDGEDKVLAIEHATIFRNPHKPRCREGVAEDCCMHAPRCAFLFQQFLAGGLLRKMLWGAHFLGDTDFSGCDRPGYCAAIF